MNHAHLSRPICTVTLNCLLLSSDHICVKQKCCYVTFPTVLLMLLPFPTKQGFTEHLKYSMLLCEGTEPDALSQVKQSQNKSTFSLASPLLK